MNKEIKYLAFVNNKSTLGAIVALWARP